jgi:site-specific DNA recombinase
LEGCSISISNLQEKIYEVGTICSKLALIWQKGKLHHKESLQKLLFPEGLSYDKKNQSFRTPKTNEAFEQIARLSGDLCKMTKGLKHPFDVKSLLAEREGFEPPVLLQTTVFKTAAIDHSAISPGAKVVFFITHTSYPLFFYLKPYSKFTYFCF